MSVLSIIMEINSDDSNEPIETFTDTPAEDTTVGDLEEAEEKIEENQDDGSDEFLFNLTDEQILERRFIDENLDYGTPSVDSSDGSCGDCSTCDAGDVVILDEGIAPVEGDPSEEEDLEELSIAKEVDDFINWGDEFLVNLQKNNSSLSEADISAMESFGELLGNLVGILKKVIDKITKYMVSTYKFSRKRIMTTHLRLQTVHSFWNHKLNKNLGKIDQDRLNDYEIEAFPYDTWIDTAKIALMSFELVRSAERVVFEPGNEAVTNSMRLFRSKLEKLGIDININKNRINMDELLDTRRYASVLDLGYTKSQLPNCLRYFGEIAKRVPKGDENTLEQDTNSVVKKITEFSASINNAVEEGRLNKNSEAYKHEVEKLVNYTVRLDFIFTCMRCAYLLFDKISLDAQRVFGKYEDALTPKKFI